jgi:hypothetical protein
MTFDAADRFFRLGMVTDVGTFSAAPCHPFERGMTDMAAKKKKAKAQRRKKSAKRELIAPRGDKRYVRRDARGRIKESDDVSRSLSSDRRRRAKKKAKKGQKDKGD